MSDVLSAAEAEAIREHWEAQSRKYSRITEYTREQGVLLLDDQIIALARSHEQLRGERDAWHQRCLDAEDDVTFEQGRVDAAARAGGCAADALREIEKGSIDGRAIRLAREAFAAYDRAVSGQTAEKEEA